MKAALVVKSAVLASIVALAACATASASPAHRASIHGLAMYYEEYGTGRPIVLLHGGGSTAQTSFGAIIPALARTHHVIAPEQQAHGHTPDIDRPLSFEQEADDTAALLERLGIRDADVIGFSNGGLVAMQLAARHPALVHRLVLCSSYFSHAGMTPAFWAGIAHATFADMPPQLRHALATAQPDPAMQQRMFDRQIALMRAFTDVPETTLRGIQAPALVMVGDSDVMSVDHEVALAHLLPHAELAVFPGAHHGSYLGAIDAGAESPALALAMIERFLGNQ